jgi:hypothetical protein
LNITHTAFGGQNIVVCRQRWSDCSQDFAVSVLNRCGSDMTILNGVALQNGWSWIVVHTRSPWRKSRNIDRIGCHCCLQSQFATSVDGGMELVLMRFVLIATVIPELLQFQKQNVLFTDLVSVSSSKNFSRNVGGHGKHFIQKRGFVYAIVASGVSITRFYSARWKKCY